MFLEEREHNERPSTRRARAYLASGAAHIRAEAETRHYIHHEYHKAFLPNSQKKVGHLSCISGYTLPSIELSRYIQYMKKVSQLLSPIACGNPCCANSTALTSYASEGTGNVIFNYHRRRFRRQRYNFVVLLLARPVVFSIARGSFGWR